MAKKAKSQPGVMIYFCDLMSIKNLTREEKGWLLESITDYGSTGKLPDFTEFEDAAQRRYLESIWNFFKSSIERDFARYIKTKEVRVRANKIKFIKANPDLRLDPTNEADINCIVTDERTGKLVFDPERAYRNETEGKEDAEFDYFPPQMEEAKRQQAARQLRDNTFGLHSNLSELEAASEKRMEDLRRQLGIHVEP